MGQDKRPLREVLTHQHPAMLIQDYNTLETPGNFINLYIDNGKIKQAVTYPNCMNSLVGMHVTKATTN